MDVTQALNYSFMITKYKIADTHTKNGPVVLQHTDGALVATIKLSHVVFCGSL